MKNTEGKVLQVGTLAALSGNTPKGMKVTYRILMGVVGVWGIVSPQFPEIPAATAHLIDRLCIIGLPTFYMVCQMFGWTKPE